MNEPISFDAVKLCATHRVKFFHTPTNEAFATLSTGGHIEHWPVESGTFQDWLSKVAYQKYHRAPSETAVKSNLSILKAKAIFEGEEHHVHYRLASVDDAIFVDLGNAKWEAIKVTSDGWCVVKKPPVKFRRSRQMKALPNPVKNGGFGGLKKLINIGSERNWKMAIAWLIGTLHPTGPYPVLMIQGEQGTAKSTMTRFLRDIIDPSEVPLHSTPKSEQDLMIMANNSRVLAFDNVSQIKDWFSDALCRLSTGGGMLTRKYYTNSDEVTFQAKCPVVLNGIEDLASRADLADRALILELEPIAATNRMPEAELWRQFQMACPLLLGALLDAVSVALGDRSSIQIDELPRMADFAIWVSAAESKLPWKEGGFLEVYKENRAEATHDLLEASSLMAELKRVVKGIFCDSATQLLKALEPFVRDGKNSEPWAKSASSLSRELRRIATAARTVGIDIRFSREGHGGKKIITIRMPDESEADRLLKVA